MNSRVEEVALRAIAHAVELVEAAVAEDTLATGQCRYNSAELLHTKLDEYVQQQSRLYDGLQAREQQGMMVEEGLVHSPTSQSHMPQTRPSTPNPSPYTGYRVLPDTVANTPNTTSSSICFPR